MFYHKYIYKQRHNSIIMLTNTRQKYCNYLTDNTPNIKITGDDCKSKIEAMKEKNNQISRKRYEGEGGCCWASHGHYIKMK